MRTFYVEKMGTGVRRINQELLEAGLPAAQFSFDEYNFSILFSEKQDVTPPITKLEEKILLILTRSPSFAASHVAEELKIGKDTVKEYFSRLKKKGLLQREGTPRNGRWNVVNSQKGDK